MGRSAGLARIFAVPDGEPIDARLAHIRQLTPGERLWFEQGVQVGDRILVPYERLDDGKPTALAVDRLMRRPAARRRPRRPRRGVARPRLGRDGGRALPGGGSAPGRDPVVDELLAWAHGSAPSPRTRTAMRWTTPSPSATTSSASRTPAS